MQIIEKYQNLINRKIDEIIFPEFPKNLYEPIKYLLSIGGKRLRPVLTLLANEMFGGKVEDAINSALGLEIFHNFTLMHDDIMDKAEMRRNRQTVHKKWNENIALLSGDAMMIMANKLIAKSNPEHLPQILELFNTTSLQVCEGQQLDMNFENQLNVTEEQYIEMIKLKTSVLIACALKMGAISANANPSELQNIYNFGLNIGLCFQLQDDYLDTYGDVNVFGKKIGGDIVANKKTFMLVTALNTSDTEKYNEILQLIENKNIVEEEKISKVIKIYNYLNIREKTIGKIHFYYEAAQKIWDKINITEDNKKYLFEYIEKLQTRNF